MGLSQLFRDSATHFARLFFPQEATMSYNCGHNTAQHNTTQHHTNTRTSFSFNFGCVWTNHHKLVIVLTTRAVLQHLNEARLSRCAVGMVMVRWWWWLWRVGGGWCLCHVVSCRLLSFLVIMSSVCCRRHTDMSWSVVVVLSS